jgi:hypothetical protein
VGVICGAVAAALALIALGIAGVLLLRRRRRQRPKYMFDEPAAADGEKRTTSGTGGTSGTNGTTGSSTISAELRKAAFHIDPKDIIIEQNEGGNVLLGRGAYGEARRRPARASHKRKLNFQTSLDWACKQSDQRARFVAWAAARRPLPGR